MEQKITFNNVVVVLTTAQRMSEVQHFLDEGRVFISIYPGWSKFIGFRDPNSGIIRGE